MFARAFGVSIVLFTACGPEALPEAEESSPANLLGRNGLGRNGLGRNGLAPNGLMNNGLGRNGLGRNGLGADALVSSGLGAEFDAWFRADPQLADMTMSYFIRCACGSSFAVTYRAGEAPTASPSPSPSASPSPSPSASPLPARSYGEVLFRDGYKYITWRGQYARASNFCFNRPKEAALTDGMTLEDRLAVSACLAAHVNPTGASVMISFRGEGVPVTDAERAPNFVNEGSFFGNLWPRPGDTAENGDDLSEIGIYSCQGTGRSTLDTLRYRYDPNLFHTSDRSCAFVTNEQRYMPGTGACDPIQYLGYCADVCPSLGEDGAYTQCSRYFGKAVATTYMYVDDISTNYNPNACLDGHCDPVNCPMNNERCE